MSHLPWIQTVRRAGGVKRMHTFPINQDYTVADHSFNAALLALYIAQQEDLPMSLHYAVQMLFHDMPEVESGDVPAPFKIKNPDVASVLVRAEEDWFQYNVPPCVGHFIERDDIYKVARAADVLEFLNFCLTERQMGNTLIEEPFWRGYAYLDHHPLTVVHQIREEIRTAMLNLGVKQP